MDARTALERVTDRIVDTDSFVQTFEPADWGYPDRFDDHGETEGLRVLGELVAICSRIIDGEVDIQSGNVAGDWPDTIGDLARTLGRFDELKAFEPWQDDES